MAGMRCGRGEEEDTVYKIKVNIYFWAENKVERSAGSTERWAWKVGKLMLSSLHFSKTGQVKKRKINKNKKKNPARQM